MYIKDVLKSTEHRESDVLRYRIHCTEFPSPVGLSSLWWAEVGALCKGDGLISIWYQCSKADGSLFLN